MSITNSLAPQQKKSTFSVFMASDAVKNKLNQMMSSKDGEKFITSIISLVSNNPAIAQCDHSTIFASALLGESLKLSPSPQLGQYYIVPFNDTKNNRTVAQFQIGYKGYIQLAMRSGNYKDLDVIEIRQGEYKGKDKFSGKTVIEFIEDDDERESLPIVGYYAYFELTNGFKKSLYWSKTKMEKHAKDYSQSYRKDLNKGWKYSFWSKDFDGMAFKTMLRQLISKWGIMSVDFQTAITNDMAVISEPNGQPQYIDNEITEGQYIDAKTVEPEKEETNTPPPPEIENDPFSNFDEG